MFLEAILEITTQGSGSEIERKSLNNLSMRVNPQIGKKEDGRLC
jgi:hypothetical protein